MCRPNLRLQRREPTGRLRPPIFGENPRRFHPDNQAEAHQGQDPMRGHKPPAPPRSGPAAMQNRLTPTGSGRLILGPNHRFRSRYPTPLRLEGQPRFPVLGRHLKTTRGAELPLARRRGKGREPLAPLFPNPRWAARLQAGTVRKSLPRWNRNSKLLRKISKLPPFRFPRPRLPGTSRSNLVVAIRVGLPHRLALVKVLLSP